MMDNVINAIRFTAFFVIFGILLIALVTSTFIRPVDDKESYNYYSVLGKNKCVKLNPCKFKLVADLDLGSKVDAHGSKYKSILLDGHVYIENDKYFFNWGKESLIYSGINESGRGMELSELIYYDGKLLSFDDRTGIVYEVMENGSILAPRYIIPEGNGRKNKGMKIEWATVRDGVLWIGSFGKEFTNNKGEIVKETNMWVVTIDKSGKITHYNWKEVYNRIRKALGAEYPGYCIHEAVTWSPYIRKWLFLPRRVSKEPYNEQDDEFRGSNKMVYLDDDLTNPIVVDVGVKTPQRGFSSFKFLPGSSDNIIVAIKSVEDSKLDKQSTYISILSVTGVVLHDEILVPSPYKYEGLEFIV